MIREKLTITKEDSTLARLIKFCVWMGIICCFLIFAFVWIIFFILLGGPTIIYKMFVLIYRHHQDKQLTRSAKHDIKQSEYDNN